MYTDFEYADKRLSDFGYVMCHINTSSGIRDVDIGCDITFTTVKNKHSSIQHITSSSYDNVYSTSFDIIKKRCGRSMENAYMSGEEVRRLVVWLNRREYRKLKLLNSANDDMNVSYYGSFNVKQIMNGSHVIGLSLTFTSNAPYGFEDEIRLQYDITDKGEHFYLNGEGDELGTIYPIVLIKFKQDCEEFYIKNLTTDTAPLVLRNCKAGETITIDGTYKLIFTDDKEHKQSIPSDFNYDYLDILVSDDDCSQNEYAVSAPCEITIKYAPVRKAGAY